MSDRLKNSLRSTLKNVRKNLSADFQKKVSMNICSRIEELCQYQAAKRIGIYYATNGEVDLSYLWQSAVLQKKDCYFPIIKHNLSLDFLPATPETPFQNNQFHIAEPIVATELAIPAKELDLIFIPVLAFDMFGTRLGFGKGYYDRTLKNIPSEQLVGIAYEFQRQPFLLAEPWDVPLPLIITEHALNWSIA
ncbi:MAG: 5-formyltetrahydrofolate cyclo-ligase [Legionella sp.]